MKREMLQSSIVPLNVAMFKNRGNYCRNCDNVCRNRGGLEIVAMFKSRDDYSRNRGIV